MGTTSKSQQNKKESYSKTATQEVTGIDPYKRQFAKQYGQLQNQYNSLVNTPVSTGSFSPIVQNALSSGIANIKAQQSSGNAQLAQQLARSGGNNSALLAALQRQSSIGSAGNINALTPAALEQQRGLDVQNRQLALDTFTRGGSLLDQLINIARTSAGSKVTESGQSESSGSSKTRKSFF